MAKGKLAALQDALRIQQELQEQAKKDEEERILREEEVR